MGQEASTVTSSPPGDSVILELIIHYCNPALSKAQIFNLLLHALSQGRLEYQGIGKDGHILEVEMLSLAKVHMDHVFI